MPAPSLSAWVSRLPMASAFNSPRGASTSALICSSAARASTDSDEAIQQRFLLRRRPRILHRLQIRGAGARCGVEGRRASAAGQISRSAAPRPRVRRAFSDRRRDDKNGGVGLGIQARGRSRSRAKLFTPDGNGFGPRAGLRCQLADPAHTHPRLCRIRFIEPSILEFQTILAHPVLPPKFRQAPRELVGYGAKIENIVRGILQLRVRQWPLRPVGAGLALRNGDIEQRLDEFGITDLRLEADAGRRDLRIENRGQDLPVWSDTPTRDPGARHG